MHHKHPRWARKQNGCRYNIKNCKTEHFIEYFGYYNSTSQVYLLPNTTIREVKIIIEKEYICVPLIQQKIYINGKEAMDDETLESLQVKENSSIFLEVHKDFFHRDDYFEVLNFIESKKMRKSDENHYNKIQGIEAILKSAEFGPLIHILSFFTPSELLLNFTIVSRTFERIIFLLVSNEIVRLTDTSLFLLFGRSKFRISESLLLKLLSLPRAILKDDTRIYRTFPAENYGKIWNVTTIIEQCLYFKYFKAVKYSVENRGFRVEKNFQLSKAMYWKEILVFLIDKLDGFSVSRRTWEELILYEEWDRIRKLLDDESVKGKEDIFDAYMSSIDNIDPGKDLLKFNRIASFERWKFFEPYFLELWDTKPRCNIRQLNDNLSKIKDWRLIRHILLSEKLKYLKKKGIVIRNEFSRNPNLCKLIVELNRSTTSKYCNIFKIYYPRFELLDACFNEDVSKIKELLFANPPRYDMSRDIHCLDFCYFPLENFSNEILHLIVPKIEIHMDQYVDAIKGENYELADILEEHKDRFVSRSYSEYKIVKVNLEKKKNVQRAIHILKTINRKKLTWGKESFGSMCLKACINNYGISEQCSKVYEILMEMLWKELSENKSMKKMAVNSRILTNICRILDKYTRKKRKYMKYLKEKDQKKEEEEEEEKEKVEDNDEKTNKKLNELGSKIDICTSTIDKFFELFFLTCEDILFEDYSSKKYLPQTIQSWMWNCFMRKEYLTSSAKIIYNNTKTRKSDYNCFNLILMKGIRVFRNSEKTEEKEEKERENKIKIEKIRNFIKEIIESNKFEIICTYRNCVISFLEKNEDFRIMRVIVKTDDNENKKKLFEPEEEEESEGEEKKCQGFLEKKGKKNYDFDGELERKMGGRRWDVSHEKFFLCENCFQENLKMKK